MNLLSICVAVSAMAFSVESGATMTFCNKTDSMVSLAVASTPAGDGRPWTVVGWLKINSRRCVEVSNVPDATKYIWAFDARGKGLKFDGRKKSCVHNAVSRTSVNQLHPSPCTADFHPEAFEPLVARSPHWTRDLERDTSSTY